MSTKTIEIKGVSYVIGYAPASEALKAGALILNLAGPGIDGLRGGFLGGAAALLHQPQLGPLVLQVAQLLAPYTQVVLDGGRSETLSKVFDAHFRGRVGAMLEWLQAAVEFNLDDFLAVVSARYDEAKDKLVASLSPSPKPAETSG